MATNYSPELVTDGAVFVGDARTSSTATAGSRLYDKAGVDSTDVKLLIHGNVGSGQSFADSSLSNHTITTVGGTTHSSAQSKFSGGSIYFDGSGDELTLASSTDWAVGATATIDCWVYPTDAYTTNHRLWCVVNNLTHLDGYIASNGYFYMHGNYVQASTQTVPRNVWTHIAVTYNSGTVKIYFNGVSQSLAGTTTGYNISNTGTLHIGQFTSGSYEYAGYMDEFRIIKGAALWTQDFTPPARRDTLSISDGMMYNGTCFDFDGTDDVVQTSDPVITGTGDFTFTAWINIASFTSSNFICGNYGTGNTSGVEFYAVHNNKLYLHIAGSVISDTLLTEDTWYHVAATRTSGLCQLYIDGVADGAAVTRASSIVGNNDFSIGNGEDYTSENMDGKIADVKFFDVALSLVQIKELYDDSKVIIPSNVSQTNLKGWWPLAEGAGDICYDGSGNGYHGTAENTDGDEWLTGQTGAPQLVEGYNRPMLFNGSSDYVTLGAANVAGASYGTVSAWINMTGAAVDHATIYACQVGANWVDMRLVLNIYAPNKIRFHLSNGTSYLANALVSSALNYNQWYHVAGTYNGTDAKIYIDGSLDATQTTSIVPGTFTPGFTAIGYMNSGTRYFPGIINEVAVYDSACTLAQIQALAATGPNGGPLPPNPASGPSTLPSTANLIGYWRNDGNVTWTDRSGNGNNGTVTGSPDDLLFKQGYTGSASTSTGRDGQGFPLKYKDVGAVGFSSGDHIEVSQSDSFKFGTGGFAIAFWFLCADFSNSDGGHYDRLFMLGDDFNTNSLNVNIKTDGKIQFRWNDSTIVSETPAISTDQWYYFVATRAGGTLYLYLNGVLEDSDSFTTNVNNAGDYGLALGAERGGLTTTSLHGSMSGAQIYNRALSQAEIKQNFNAQASRFQVPRSIVMDGLVLWLDAENPGSYPGSGNIVYDLSGNDNDFTHYTYGSASAPTISEGAFSFNGSTQYLNIDSGIFTLNQPYTLYAFVKPTDLSSDDLSFPLFNSYNGGTAGFWHHYDDNGYVQWRNSGSTGTLSPGHELSNGSWACTAITWDGSTITVYKNGVMINYQSAGGYGVSDYGRIGMLSYRNTQNDYNYNGLIANQLLYTRALSAAEIQQNFRVQRERFGI